MKLLIIVLLLLLFANKLSSKEYFRYFEEVGLSNFSYLSYSGTKDEDTEIKQPIVLSVGDTIVVNHLKDIKILETKPLTPKSQSADSARLIIIGAGIGEKGLDQLSIKNNFTKKLLGYFITNQNADIAKTGEQSISYFKQFSGKRIASIRFIRLHPFGTSFQDTTRSATKWIEKAGNRLHMNTARLKLRMNLLFKIGDLVNPLLMAENEKIIRDLEYLEDVFIRLDPVENNQEEVNVVILTKDRFEYAFSMSINSSNSDVELVNENMFGMGHRLNFGIAQQNATLPHMGIYFSYGVNNILGKFINSTIGYSDTYLKRGWNLFVEKKFLTSNEKNAGGISLEQISRYNHITENHPIKLDSVVAYYANDFWFMHAFPDVFNPLGKTILSFRYYNQQFKRSQDDSYGVSPFIRDHDFFLTSLSFSRRNLYKNNQIYGYGVTEDIPYGHYYEFTTGLDKSQFGIWPYIGFSLNNAYVDKAGRYYSYRLALDGFLDNGVVRQGSLLASANFFSKKFIAFGDPFRGFVKVELLSGINRLKEEYLTIDGRFGIRDFYTNDLKGYNRLKFNFESVRYLKKSFYNFKFTQYLFADFAFLSDKPEAIFQQNFYAGIGTGLRIFNESLVFKIIDIRLTWFPLTPPEGLPSFGANLQGLTKSRFDDFMGRKPEVIRYQ